VRSKTLLVIFVFVALLLVGLGAFVVAPVSAATAGNEGSFVMPATGAAASISVANVYMPFGGRMTVYLKNSEGTTIGTNSDSDSWGDVTVTFPFDEVMVYAGQTYSIVIEMDPPSSDYGGAYITYTPYYLITVTSAYGSPTASAYVRSGENYATSVTSPASGGTGVQYVCTGYAIDGGSPTAGTSYTFTSITAAHTIVYNWKTQYEVTYSATGLDASTTGTVVTVDSVAKAYGNLPFTKWVDSGASTSFTFGSTVTSSATGKQFRLSSSVSSPQTITGPTTITDGYTIQYLLTVNANGHSSGIGGGYYDAGSTAYAYLASTQVYDGDYTRYNFASWSGSGSGRYTGSSSTATVTMNAPITETANWQTQYYLSVVGVYSTTTGSGWYNAGATANFNVSSPVSGGSGTQLAFSSWTGAGSGRYTGSTQAASCTMNAPITETASWVTQYYLTVTSTYGTTTGQGWYNSGATAYAGLTSGSESGGAGTRYAFSSWSVGGSTYSQSDPITMTSPVTATASWSTQYYLTVSSPYSTTSGENWYNSGATAYAGVATNIVSDGDGTHTLQGWTGGASGTSITSNPITMTGPTTATAVWSTTGGSSGPTSYNVILHGPYYEDGTAAAGDTISCTIYYANNTAYQFTMNSSVGEVTNIALSSTSSFVQLQWNASSTLNYTRIYRFIANVTSDEVNLYIPRSTQPSFVYTFSITDFYGMSNPYLESRISPDGVNNYVVERADLAEGGTVTFIMTQYQMYSLAFVCDQGTYSQSFTAQIQGTPGQYAVSLNVLAGNFPSTNATTTLFSEATRLNSTTVSLSYVDPTGNTSWVYVQIYHNQGSSAIVDYTVNNTGSVQLILWQLAQEGIDYYVYVQAYSGGELHTWTLPTGTSYSNSNPFLGLLDFLGQPTDTVPYVQTGWPLGMTSAQIAQLIGAFIVMLFLCIGSFKSAGVCCIVSWIIFGVLMYLGWMGTVTPYTIPMFAFSGFVALFIAIDEGKATVREA